MHTRDYFSRATSHGHRGAWLCRLALVLAGLSTPGCQHTQYEIELTPDGDSMKRELGVWQERQSDGKTEILEFSAEELKRIADAYMQHEPEADGKKRRFSGQFRDAVPSDVGGAGWYLPLKTSMGSVAGYVERIRGNDDVASELSLRLEAADALVTITLEWLESAIGEQQGFAALRKAIDDDIRRDVRNFCMYVFAYELTVDEPFFNSEECFARMGQYLVERAYFKPGEAPKILRAFDDTGRDKPAALIALVKRMLARKMGVADDAALPEILNYFDDPVRFGASLEKHLATTDHYKELRAKWQREKDAGKTVQPDGPDPLETLQALFQRTFFPEPSLGRDQLALRLNSPVKPFSTNGTWDERTRSVVWSRSMASAEGKTRPPIIVFAFWATPDAEFQKKHFGKTLLVDGELSRYCLWYGGLDKSEAEQWDQFLAGLAPGDDLIGQLMGFAFQGEPPPTKDGPQGLAYSITQNLISRLKD